MDIKVTICHQSISKSACNLNGGDSTCISFPSDLLNAVCMCLVFHDGVRRQVQNPFQCVPDSGGGHAVTRCPVPQ